MAKFKVLKGFKGLKENKSFKFGDVIELTIERADEISANIEKDFNVTDVLERVEEQKEKEEDKNPLLKLSKEKLVDLAKTEYDLELKQTDTKEKLIEAIEAEQAKQKDEAEK